MKPRFNYFKAPDLDNEKNRHIVFYCEWGDPQNTDIVVCVHGLSRNSRDFDYLASGLADKYRVICLDVVGRGKSEWLHDKSGYDYETYVSDVIKLFDHLGIRKVDWVGTSMGGIIGMIIAARYSHIVKNLVLNDIGPMIPGDAVARILKNVGSAREFHNKIDAEKALRDKMATFGINSEEHWAHIVKHSIIKRLNGKFSFAYDPHIIPPPKLVYKLLGMLTKILPVKKKSGFLDVVLFDIWEKISCPILALRGKLSDVLTEDVVSQMSKSGKDLRVIEFDNIGHAPMLMDEVQISIVKNWLVQHK